MIEEQVDQIMNKITGTQGPASTNTTSSLNDGERDFFCDAKNQEELNDFIDNEKPKLVVLVGFAGYGKSTFIGSLYQQLIANINYDGYRFVDSDTYVGFERRVFLRRINANNISDTKRNILGENDLLNFKLRSNKGMLHQIVVSDKAGETYSKYISSDKEIENDIVLENADLVLFFVDAEQDCTSLAAHNLIAERYESILTRLKKLGKLKEKTPYALVLTKVDKVTDDERKKKLADRREKLGKLFMEYMGVSADDIYEVNSKDLANKRLNELFVKIISPKLPPVTAKELDWVRMDIEKK